VLVKETDGIWRRAIVINVSDEKCQVKLESNGTLVDTTLENIFPLGKRISVYLHLKRELFFCKKSANFYIVFVL